MKKIIVFLTAVCVLTFTACGGSKSQTQLSDKPEVTEAPETTEVPEVTETPEVTEVPEVTEAPETTEVPEVTEAPETTEVSEATSEQIMMDIEIVIEAALDYVNENDDCDGATMFSNALLKGTSYKVLFADKSTCEIEFEYPDAAAYLLMAAEMLGDNAPVEEVNEILWMLSYEMEYDTNKIKKTVTADVCEKGDGTYTVVWNDALYDAISGGLYSAQAEEGE